VLAQFELAPHPEGGFFAETYRAPDMVDTPRGRRSAVTAVLFLVTASSSSRFHRLQSDERWVYQGGCALELVTLSPEGRLRRHMLGDADHADSRGDAVVSQVLVPAGTWQAAQVRGDEGLPGELVWSLQSCVVTPGFEYEDFELGDRDALLEAHPDHAEIIRALT
jgi:hypothetical protein